MISAFSVMTGYTSGTENAELLEDHEDLGYYERYPANNSVGIEVYPGMEVTLMVNISDGIGNDTNVVFHNATDDVIIGEDTEVGDEEWAEATWEDLDYGTEYEWYVNITDADNEDNYTVSETWSFTTEHIPNMPELVRPGDGDVVPIYPDMETELNVSVRHPEGEMMNVTFYDASDDTEIGHLEQVDDGDVNVIWDDLEYGTIYEWYVNVTEYLEEDTIYTVSDTWTFTTEHIPNMPELVRPGDGEVVPIYPDMETELNVSVRHPEGEMMNVTFYDGEDNVIGEPVNEVGDGYVDVLWEELEFGTVYEWYVNVTEAYNEDENYTESETWNFTTEEEPVMYNLTLEIKGDGAVTVEWNEEEETVTDDEILEFKENTTVTLTSDPDEGYHFVEWTGNVSSTDGQIDITMDGDKEITAWFEESEQPFFEVKITEYDEEIEEGRYITVEFTVENTGDVKGTQNITFSVGGSEEDEKVFTIEPDEERSGKFFWQAEAGSHLLTVASEDDSDTVAVNVYIDEPGLLPGFTSFLLVLATIFAVLIYHKKKRR